MLSWVLDRIRAVPEIERIVVCAPNEPASADALVAFCRDEGVDIFLFSGDVNDVIGRLHAAAIQFAARICVMVSGDCPLVASDVISLMVGELLDHPDVGWVTVQKADGSKTIHEGLVVARVEVWAHADRLSTEPELREHQFPILWRNPGLFSKWETRVINDLPKYDVEELRISVDTAADLEFMRGVWNSLREHGNPFDLEHVLQAVRRQPQLRLVNDHVHQRSLYENPLSVVFVITAVERFGYGNLLRSFEIANELVERWGASVQLCVTDEIAEKLCTARGFRSSVVNIMNVLNIIQHSCDLFVFDVNSKVALPLEMVRAIQERGSKVAVIDNVCEAAKIANTVVIPTVHHVGSLWSHARMGADYVVIRKSIRRIRSISRDKENMALVYPGRCSLDVTKRAVAELIHSNPGIRIEQVTRLRSDFADLLAHSKYVLCPLSQTAYEGVYLGAVPVLLSEECSLAEEARFMDFCTQIASGDGEGALRIGQLLIDTARGLSNRWEGNPTTTIGGCI